MSTSTPISVTDLAESSVGSLGSSRVAASDKTPIMAMSLGSRRKRRGHCSRHRIGVTDIGFNATAASCSYSVLRQLSPSSALTSRTGRCVGEPSYLGLKSVGLHRERKVGQ